MKNTERRKMHTLSAEQLSEVRQQQKDENEAARKIWRRRRQKRSQWGNNEYVDDDFVSYMLVKWPLSQLVIYTKLLLVLMNRRVLHSEQAPPLPRCIASLVFYKYPSEYYETLFGDYTFLEYREEVVSFRNYYNTIYHEARDALNNGLPLTQQEKKFHVARLRAFFMVALTYDARVRRFVFSKHDIHYDVMHTHPPPIKKTAHFIQTQQHSVDLFLQQKLDAANLSDQVCALWASQYMFLLE